MLILCLNNRDVVKLTTFNPSFQYLFWVNGKIRNDKMEEFIKYIKGSPCFKNQLKDIYMRDDLIPSKVPTIFYFEFFKINK